MEEKFLRATFDLDCDWEGLSPAYRIYVNDELFAERTWIWEDYFLTETLQILVAPGMYKVALEPVLPNLAKFKITNRKIEYGSGRWVNNDLEVF